MTVLLKEVFDKASGLPEHLQDMLARELLQEIEWEEKWDDTLSRSHEALDKLTQRAMAQYQKGKTVDGGFDKL